MDGSFLKEVLMYFAKASLFSLLAVSVFCPLMKAQQALPSSLSAQPGVPRLVNFSGKLSDAQGKPVSGIAGVTFSIYQDRYQGTPLWIETQSVQGDAKGSYTAQLGATGPEGLPADLFSSGAARWLGVRVNGAEEQPRVLLLSVPYALKAADAETVGGLPPSAFVLAAPVSSGGASSNSPTTSISTSASVAPPATSNVTTTGGTVNALPLWTTTKNIQNSVIAQTGTGATAKIGIGTTAPAVTLDVKGAETVRGALTLPATGAATSVAGKNSQPQDFVASSFSSTTTKAVNQSFQWQAEPAANNTATPSGTLNLLYGLGVTAPSETGLKLSNNGIFTFAAGQTFPGTGAGTVKSVGLTAPASDFTVSGSPVTSTGTLRLAWAVSPTNSDTANAIVKRDANGSFTAGAITANLGMLGVTATDSGNGVAGINNGAGTAVYGGGSTGVGVWGQSFGTGPVSDGVHGVTGSAGGSGVAGVNNGGGVGVYGTGGIGVFGTGSAYGFQTDSNVQQARAAGGWVKAMVYVNAHQTPFSIVRCFNSTLVGAAATTPPCGISLTAGPGTGLWMLDFGFQITDRFVSATAGTGGGLISTCLSDVTDDSLCSALTPNQIFLWIWNSGSSGNTTTSNFHLIIY
jgi:hypothetical protein